MTARGRGLEHIRPLVLILLLGRVVSLVMLLAMVHVAADQSLAVIDVVEKVIAYL